MNLTPSDATLWPHTCERKVGLLDHTQIYLIQATLFFMRLFILFIHHSRCLRSSVHESHRYLILVLLQSISYNLLKCVQESKPFPAEKSAANQAKFVAEEYILMLKSCRINIYVANSSSQIFCDGFTTDLRRN